MDGSIRKRGEKSWELTIDLGRDEQGKRKRKFVNVNGTKGEAQKKLREPLSANNKSIPINTQKITVGQWTLKWMDEHVRPKNRQMTQERYERIIQRYIVPGLGHMELAKLIPSNIQAFEARLSSQGMAHAGVQLVHAVLSGSLKYALRMEVIWRNPAHAVTPPPDIAGVRHMLELAKAEQHPLFPCLQLIAYTGIRRGEALGRRWQDTDLGAGTILITQTLSRSIRKGLIFQPPKTNSGRRTIDLDE